MLAHLHEQRWAITAMLSDRSVTKLADTKTLELNDDQTIEMMLPVLQSLKTANEALGGEKLHVCLHGVSRFLCRFV